MAISITAKDDFKNKLIDFIIDEDSDQLDPCFATFKRISQISEYDEPVWYWNTLWNIKLFQKASNKIDLFEINKQQFKEMDVLSKDHNFDLIVDHLCVYNHYNKMKNKYYEIVNQINPKIISFTNFPFRYFTFENIKALPLLNCTNVNVYPSVKNKNFFWFDLSFSSTTIRFCDSKSDQILNFEWESVTFGIDWDNFIKIKLFETSTSNYLVIPSEDIEKAEYSGLKAISSTHELNKQFANLDIKQQEEYSWLIVNLRNLIKLYFGLDEDPIKLSDSSQQVLNQIMKARHIDWIIQDLRELLEVNKFLPDHFSRINFIFYSNFRIRENFTSETMKTLDYIDPKFSKIKWYFKLDPNEFQLWWKILGSHRTRFNLTSIQLKFKVLSECLTVLSLCAECPELESIHLEYLESDIKNEQQIVEEAKGELRSKNRFIRKLEIIKYWE